MKLKAHGACAFACLFSLSLLLSGCGGSFQGSLTGRDGDGTGPKPGTGQAQVTALSPTSVAAGSAPFTLTVTGVNFQPSTTVVWDGHELPTTYVSSKMLKAQVPADYLTQAGRVSIVPGPLGAFNFGSVFDVTQPVLSGNSDFVVSKAPIQASDMVWSATNGRLYLSASIGDATYSSSLVALDPQSGQFGTVLKTPTPPGVLAVSNDGAMLYAAYRDTFVVRRYTLPSLQENLTLPLRVGTDTNYFASDLQVQPTDAHAVAVARLTNTVNYRNQGDVVVFDDASARSQAVGTGRSVQVSRILWSADGQTIFGADQQGTQSLYLFSVDGSGTQLRSTLQSAYSLTGALHQSAAGDLLYLNGGAVLNSSTAARAGYVPVNAIQQGFNPEPVMTIDPAVKIAYFLGTTIANTTPGTYLIEAFDTTDLHLLGVAAIPNVTGKPTKLVRWGDHGLAFLTTDSAGGGKGAVYIVNGGFVTHPAP